MRFLVICRPSPGYDPAEFAQRLPEEAAVLRWQKEQGVLVDVWSPGGPGAVLMIEAANRDSAAGFAAALPLRGAGLVTAEVIELHPVQL
ncbi:MAG TPA: hypothetical protein VIL94_06830 [Acidothermaceae bacterium]